MSIRNVVEKIENCSKALQFHRGKRVDYVIRHTFRIYADMIRVNRAFQGSMNLVSNLLIVSKEV